MSPTAPDPAGAVNDAHDSSGMVPGVDHAGLTRWLSTVLRDATPPLEFQRIGVGQSNLTYVVSDAAQRRWVLRRPPVGNLLHSAHDVLREARILAALA
ncbi:MAG: hypothetical protein QOH34_1761, partial [Mycobacterium sp.]|nr:hypothetical protein [Mycobacterium sp.]